MNGRQRNATNAQIWGKQNDSNYDGNCTSRHCLSGTYEISGRWIFVGGSVRKVSVGIKSAVLWPPCLVQRWKKASETVVDLPLYQVIE